MTSRSSLLYLQTLLQDSWQTSYPGRINDVPQPVVEITSSEENTRFSQEGQDLIFISGSGGQSVEPRSLGWTEERREERATIDIRTSENRERLEGTRDENNQAEEYGGLRGEVKRIMDTVRTGDAEYDWISAFEWNDQSDNIGYGFWRGSWEIRLVQVAPEVNP